MNNLKKYRLLSGLSQSQLSKVSDVKLRMIQALEQEEIDINKTSIEKIYKLSKALNVSMEEICNLK